MTGSAAPSVAEIAAALARDRVIDIITIGARTGATRVTEILFTRVDDAIYLCGTPGPRDWLANVAAQPRFVFRLKESVHAELTAQATVVRDPVERVRVLAAPTATWYRSRSATFAELLAGAPIVRVRFPGDLGWTTRAEPDASNVVESGLPKRMARSERAV